MDPIYEALGYLIVIAVLFLPVVWFVPYFIWTYYRLDAQEGLSRLRKREMLSEGSSTSEVPVDQAPTAIPVNKEARPFGSTHKDKAA
jgi:hypothetical protein